ncbi:hypothetical protein BDQ17DRAFT_1359620 [Cyathus striatus]|nr:hypothetical protein BDQ17DRAFT_1359620 [Cyathus striatus]
MLYRGPKHGASHGHFNIAETVRNPVACFFTISDGAVCSGIFKDRKSKPLSVLLGNNNKPFSDPEPNLKGAQIGRANDGISYFSIRLWHEPGENPQKIFFGLDFMPDPVKERFQSARFEVSFARDDPQGQHPPLKILDMFPASTAHVDTTPYDNRSISTFSTSGVDLPSEQEIVNDTSTVVNGDGMLSPTAVWTFVEDENLKMKRGLDAHYTVSVTLPSVDRVWMKFYTKAILLGERIGPWRKVTLQSGSLEAPYKRILDLSE